MNFQETLEYGQVGESLIARWLRRKGWYVLPVYEIEIDTGKGPRLFGPKENLIAPDMLVFKANNTLWIEAKHKTAFTWHRISQRWTTGIDFRHYKHYLQIDEQTEWDVWLMFLQRGGRAKGDSQDSPAGLFGNTLTKLRDNENHRHPRCEPHDMVYWNIDALIKLAELNEMTQFQIVDTPTPYVTEVHSWN